MSKPHVNNTHNSIALPDIALTLPLIAGELDLVGVDDDDVIANVLMRGVRWLMLSAKDWRHDGCQPAHRLVLGIDQMPRALKCSSGEGHGGMQRRTVAERRCATQYDGK